MGISSLLNTGPTFTQIHRLWQVFTLNSLTLSLQEPGTCMLVGPPMSATRGDSWGGHHQHAAGRDPWAWREPSLSASSWQWRPSSRHTQRHGPKGRLRSQNKRVAVVMSTAKLESTGTCQAPSSFYPNLLLVPGRFELGIGRKFFTERCGQGSGEAAREVRR